MAAAEEAKMLKEFKFWITMWTSPFQTPVTTGIRTSLSKVSGPLQVFSVSPSQKLHYENIRAKRVVQTIRTCCAIKVKIR
ncbi:hypothetical protein CHS0354_040557 [Potamilus streckersoni]|uniref:Uncharacterized protein n=1 Tax=Potamilus streckersoni TaxID=2493646 RepID=A0AAE0VWD9_9BIVA|nr:hypothetical protein CHS0354_040557 [Potamilus streckersoni]